MCDRERIAPLGAFECFISFDITFDAKGHVGKGLREKALLHIHSFT